MIDTKHMAPDELVRHFPSECGADDYDGCAPEGAFIAVMAVVLTALMAIAAVAAIAA